MDRFELLVQQSIVLPITDDVLDRAAELWAYAFNHGFPRNDADLIIAATAIESGRELVTGNTSHYSWIPNVILDDWRTP